MSDLFVIISIKYWMPAVSQSLPMLVKSTFEGVDGSRLYIMAWQCIPGVYYLVAVE